MSLLDMFRAPKSVKVYPPHIQERLNAKWNDDGQLLCIRSGNKKDLHGHTLRIAEIGYCEDTNEYFIGTGNGYRPFEEFKLLASNMYIERGHGYFIGLDKLGYEKFLNSVNEK